MNIVSKMTFLCIMIYEYYKNLLKVTVFYTEIKYFKKSPFLHWTAFFLHKLQKTCLLFWHWFQLSNHLNFDWWDQSKHIFRQALKYRGFFFSLLKTSASSIICLGNRGTKFPASPVTAATTIMRSFSSGVLLKISVISEVQPSLSHSQDAALSWKHLCRSDI